jgi:hypothetical protein
MLNIPIQTIRSQKVILDSDLAKLYEVTTKRLNEQVKRNEGKFPNFFRFQLTKDEYEILRSQNATSSKGHGGRRYMPYVFTEHGALQAANVLNSEKADAMSVYIISAFVQMRKELAISQEVLKRLAQIDKKLLEHDNVIEDLVHSLIPLLEEPTTEEKPSMGFNP